MKFVFNSGLFVLAASLMVMVSSPSEASEVQVEGRIYFTSCRYYSGTHGDFRIKYKNADLPWGTQVTLIHGLGGIENQVGGRPAIPVRWEQRQEMTLPATAPYTWIAQGSSQLGFRSSPTLYNELEFVFRIQLPDGRVQYDLGGQGPWAYYKVSFLVTSADCVDQDLPPTPMTPIAVELVDK